MAEKDEKKDQVVKTSKGNKKEKREKPTDEEEKSKSKRKSGKEKASTFSLLADENNVDSNLSSLFAVQQPSVKPKPVSFTAQQHDNEDELSELDEELEDGDDSHSDGGEELGMDGVADEATIAAIANQAEEDAPSKRKRKRKNADEELEDAYMSRLAREEEKDAERLAGERAAKRQRKVAEEQQQEVGGDLGAGTGADVSVDHESDVVESDDEDDAAASPPPKHETEIAKDVEVEKANRTVFLGNVSTTAISSKSSRKTLLTHLASFIEKLPESKAGIKPRVESIRFRSTPYASAIPKKAAYAKKELMDATTKSTNAYVVYSSPALAREACQRLNGTVILDRHLRVDSIAHPAKIDNRRCVFVGNLGFVDDESNIQDANEEDGREKRKRGKEPADSEEGLWRTFGKCGKVESVRVIRDSTTRVGKGIAYVQFEDENAVEAALLLNEKKFPPMLPRKLRVSRAKAPKKNAKAGSDRPVLRAGAGSGYQRKITGEEASRMGRSAKLLGRAAAAKQRRDEKGAGRSLGSGGNSTPLGNGIKKPEQFIFEGHRASTKGGKSGLKLGGKKAGGTKSKVTKRSSAFKRGGKKA